MLARFFLFPSPSLVGPVVSHISLSFLLGAKERAGGLGAPASRHSAVTHRMGGLYSHPVGLTAGCQQGGSAASDVWAWIIRPRMRRVLGLMWPPGSGSAFRPGSSGGRVC